MDALHTAYMRRQEPVVRCSALYGMQPSANALIALHTPRLQLEPVSSANAKALWHLMRSPHLRDYQDIPKLLFEQFAHRVATRPPCFVRGAVGRFEWLLYHQACADPVGWISVRTSDANPFTGELGYTLLVEWRRKGLGSEAVRIIIDTVFMTGVVDRVTAYCLPENTGSRGILARVGLIEQRRLKRGAVVRGLPVDILLFELDAMSWRRNKKRTTALTNTTNKRTTKDR